LKTQIGERDDVRRVIHLLIAIALLPAHQAQGALKVLTFSN